MSATLDKSQLPDAQAYFSSVGLKLVGAGKWRTGPCPFHGGSDSIRINIDKGCWVCMACGAKGGDVLSFHMQHHGMTFVEAARDLGVLTHTKKGTAKPQPFSARDALVVLRFEALLCATAACNLARGVILTEKDRARLVTAAGRINFICDGVVS